MQEKEQNISPIKQRILSFIETLNISKREFYAEVGISRGTLESKTGITEDVLAKFIARYPHVSTEWLINGSGEMCNYIQKSNIKSNFSSIKNDAFHLLNAENIGYLNEQQAIYRGIPLVPTKAEAGIFSGEVSIFENDCTYYIVPDFHGADFLITVHGESMYPNYKAGDIVACKKIASESYIEWGRVYVIDTDRGPIIKRIKHSKQDGVVLIVSDNPDFSEFEIQKESIRNLALVLGSIRTE